MEQQLEAEKKKHEDLLKQREELLKNVTDPEERAKLLQEIDDEKRAEKETIEKRVK